MEKDRSLGTVNDIHVRWCSVCGFGYDANIDNNNECPMCLYKKNTTTKPRRL